MPDLKPCPFCGGVNVEVNEDPLMVCGNRYWFIVHRSKDCTLCSEFDWWHSSAKFNTKGKAVEAWNRRAREVNDV